MGNTNEKAVTLAQMIEAHKKSNAAVQALSKRVDVLATAGGEPNKIESVKVNGEAVAVTGKAVNITVPTSVSALENDSKFQTETQVRTMVREQIAKSNHASFEEVDTLPDPDIAQNNVMYLLMNPETGHRDIYVKTSHLEPMYANTNNFAEAFGLSLDDGDEESLTIHFDAFDVGSIKVDNQTTLHDLADKLNKALSGGWSASYDEETGRFLVTDGYGREQHFTFTDQYGFDYKLENGSGGLVYELVLIDDTTVDLSGVVEKEEGKGLSSNDFTDEHKSKLEGIEFATDEEVAAALAEIYGGDGTDGEDGTSGEDE